MRVYFVIILCFSLVVGCNNTAVNNDTHKQWTFHTTPDKWEDSRIFQTPFDNRWDDRISISRQPFQELKGEKVYSPNKAYWYIIEVAESTGQENIVKLYLFNERQYLIEITLLDKYLNFDENIKWLNEKLVFIRVFWGIRLGMDMIFDVEEELVIYKELVHDGSIPFLQWQQAKQKN